MNFDITPVDIGGDALNRVAAKDIALVEKSSAQRITPFLQLQLLHSFLYL